MSGYREHGFDPNSYEQPGRPLRPFNWVQWTGVGFAILGLAIDAFYFAGRLGWVRPAIDAPTGAIGPIMLGVILVNSRREPDTLVTDEQRARNRKVLLITTLILVVVLGAATVIQFAGA